MNIDGSIIPYKEIRNTFGSVINFTECCKITEAVDVH